MINIKILKIILEFSSNFLVHFKLNFDLKEESEELKDKIQVHCDAMMNVEWQVSTLYFAFQDQFPSFN